MKSRNLRHFRVFLAVANLCSVTLAADHCRVSQPAVTQCLAKLERDAGGVLFDRTAQGVFLTKRGAVIRARLIRAMGLLDGALSAVSDRLPITATSTQLQALIAVAEAQNVTLAARNLGLAQPTVHRAISQLEREAARPLFERTPIGMVATKPCRALAQSARLAFSEFGQVEADLAEFDGRDVGMIVVGTLPLARSAVLPEALARFRVLRQKQRVTVLDGPYNDMLGGVRRGDIDVMIGALRDPLPIEDVVQEPLFDDSLSFVVRVGHPLSSAALSVEALAQQQWVVPRLGTPSRAQFNGFFEAGDIEVPESIVECGSILLMREMLARTNMLGCISSQQAKAEIANGLLVALYVDRDWDKRPIGLTYRKGWVPTKAQEELLGFIRAAASDLHGA